MESARRTQPLHQLATTDHLTGAFNRRYFYETTDRMLARARRNNSRIVLLIYDIDDFKHYNETVRPRGRRRDPPRDGRTDEAISRSHDIVARIGGDEFAVLFWDADRPRVPGSQPLATAFDLADRFRRAVSHHQFRTLGPEAGGVLTISGGLASFPRDGVTRDALMRSADKALREAKQAGKNSIRLIG